MSRLGLPRRFGAVAAAVAASLSIASAEAQVGGLTGRDRDSTSRTTIGAPNAQACSQFVAAGDSSDNALAVCDRAFGERLSHAVRIATLINRGALHLRRQQGERALADFDAVIAIDRRNPEAHLNRGAALVMLGRHGAAVAAITEALSLGVQEPHKAYFNRGAARESLGDLRGAFEDYSTALDIQPNWGPANEELARFVRRRRDHLAERLTEPEPED